jgi:hypothetical protein
MDWTVDTCILYKAARAEGEAAYFLLRIAHQKHCVAFDHEGYIERQYRRCLSATKNPLLTQWFQAVVSSLVARHSGQLHNKHQRALEKLKFKQDDWPFVGVCSRTENKNLVSEDSDYTSEVTQYLAEQIGISVLAVEEAVARCG